MIRSIAFAGLAALILTGCDSGVDTSTQEIADSSGPSYTPAPPPPLPGKMVRSFAGTPLPELTFADPDGNELEIAGLDQPVLINLWATWCVPCRKEMPALDMLAKELEGEVRVLTISQDIRGAEVVVPYFAEQGFDRLEPWLDPTNELGATFSDSGLLPMTILFDADGKEVLRVAGDYAWDTEDAIAEVREALAASNS